MRIVKRYNAILPCAKAHDPAYVVPSPGSQRIYRDVQTDAASGITLLFSDDNAEQIDTNARDYTESPQ